MANITINEEKKGIEIRFSGKPEQEIIDSLKENGFRWSGKQKMWYAKQTDDRMKFAESLGEVKEPEKNVFDLWEATRTEGIGNNYEKTGLHDTKEIAAIIRKELRTRFPFCKWSVRSDFYSINVDLKSSPFGKDDKGSRAIINYARKLVASYNYNNSDIMTDYFDVNFYAHVEIAWDYKQTEAPEIMSEIMDLFMQKEEEFAKAEAIRHEQEFKEYQKKMEEEEKASREFAAMQEHNRQKIEDNFKSVDVDYTFKNVVLKANKDDNLNDTSYFDERNSRETCQVSREIHFEPEIYDLFVNQLLTDFSFLEGMGGNRTDDLRVNSYYDLQMMDDQTRQTVEFYCCNCVAIFSGDDLKLIIDPQGYGYARYVYVPDDNSEKVYDYHSSSAITQEECDGYKEQAEKIENEAKKFLENIESGYPNNDEFKQFKTFIIDFMEKSGIKFDVNVVRMIYDIELKQLMYRVLNESDSLADQMAKAQIEKGQKITIVKIGGLGGITVNHVTFDNYVPEAYAQYDKAVTFIFKPKNKKKFYKQHIYDEVLIFDGWVDIPDSVFSNSEDGRTVILSFDTKNFDKVLEYFNDKGVKPLVNTYKPQF